MTDWWGRAHQRGWWLLVLLVLGLVQSLGMASFASANGGQVRVAGEHVGPFIVTVYTSPIPLQTGTADVSVLVQRPDTQDVVNDATVTVTMTPVGDESAAKTFPATHDQATNKLYYAANIPVDRAGRYHFTVTVQGADGSGTVSFDADVVRGTPSIWRSWWFWGAVVILEIPVLWWLFLGRGRTRAKT
ncbi:MAG: hypothetical protein IRY86_08950 [Thermorudis peleae]|nr:hypothetical protein [Thermorudis peleae]